MHESRIITDYGISRIINALEICVIREIRANLWFRQHVAETPINIVSLIKHLFILTLYLMLKHKDITEKIIGSAFEVHKFLGMVSRKSSTKEH